MTPPKRPARAILLLIIVATLALGIAAFLINVPVLWVIVGEVLALAAVGVGATRLKQPQPVATLSEGGPAKPK